MNLFRVGTLFCVGLLLASCGNLNSVHRHLNTDDGDGVLIDIKQRGILVGRDRAYDRRNSETKTTTPKEQYYVMCAEPSPDALSAYASSLLASGQVPKGSGQIGAALSEGAAYTGLRTQSIQLLRDSFYRICEAYMNGALSAGQYDLLMRRYQKHTVALLAVEQLTGTVRSPAVVINTEATGPNLEVQRYFQQKLDASKKELTALEAEKKKADEAKEAEKSKELDAKISALKTAIAADEKELKELSGGQIATKASGSVEPMTPATGDKTTVASAVKDIVEGVTQVDDFLQLCMIHIATQAEKEMFDNTKAGTHAQQGVAWSDAMVVFNEKTTAAAKGKSATPPSPSLTYAQLYTGLCRQRIEAATWHTLADLEVKKALSTTLLSTTLTAEQKLDFLKWLQAAGVDLNPPRTLSGALPNTLSNEALKNLYDALSGAKPSEANPAGTPPAADPSKK